MICYANLSRKVFFGWSPGVSVNATMKKNKKSRSFSRFQWKTRYLKGFKRVFHFWCNFEKVAPALADTFCLKKNLKKVDPRVRESRFTDRRKKNFEFFLKKIFFDCFSFVIHFWWYFKKVALALADTFCVKNISKKWIHVSVRADLLIAETKFLSFFLKNLFFDSFPMVFHFWCYFKKVALALADTFCLKKISKKWIHVSVRPDLLILNIVFVFYFFKKTVFRAVLSRFRFWCENQKDVL